MSQKTLARKSAPVPAVAPAKKTQSRIRYWVKEILTTGAVLLIVALFLAGGITPDTFGLIVGCVAIGGAVYMTAVPVAEESTSRKVAAGIYAFSAIWIACALIPFWSLVKPGAPSAKVELAAEGDEKIVGKLASGHYQIVETVPRNAVAGETRYVVAVTWPGGEERLDGKFMKTDFRGRRGRSTSASIHSANRDEVSLGGGETKVRLESVEGSLSGPVFVSFFKRQIPYFVWLILEFFVLAGAASLDALFADRKRRSTITIGACFTLVFVEIARQSISPSHVQRPLIGAAIGAFVAAALLGYLLNTIARAIAGRLRQRPV